MTDDSKMESRIRARAGRRGYRVIKCRRALSLDNFGEFMLVDSTTSVVVFGVRYDASLEEIDSYLSAP